jgi:F-type H+-transporting ATPase subunit b
LEQLAPLGINVTFLITQIVNFVLLAFILYRVAWGPITRMLDKRRETIAKGIEDARVAAEARANAEKEAEAILAKAQTEAEANLRGVNERADRLEVELRAALEKKIEAERTAALSEFEQERLQLLAELRAQVPALAIAAAQKVIGENLDEKRQHALLNEFFSGIKAGKVVVLDDAALTGSSAQVISALPLTGDEQQQVRSQVLSKLGSGAEVTFHVDPGILGGLVVRAGGKMVDGSVAGQLEGLRRSLS